MSSGSSSAKQMHHHHHGSNSLGSRPAPSRVQRKPESVWGDWREYKSTSGRPYFYNSRTRVNSWARPDGWDPGRRTNGARRDKPPTAKITANLMDAMKTAMSANPAVVNSSEHHHHHHQEQKHRGPVKKRPLPTSTPASTATSAPNIVTPTKEAKPENGDHHQPVKQQQQQLPARLTRAEEFKRVIDEIPKLPEYPDFEALRPLTDNNLISDDVRKLTNEPNEKQIIDINPSKTKLHQKLANNSTKLKHLRAKVRRCQVMRSYLDDRLSNYRSEMKILIEGGSSEPVKQQL